MLASLYSSSCSNIMPWPNHSAVSGLQCIQHSVVSSAWESSAKCTRSTTIKHLTIAMKIIASVPKGHYDSLSFTIIITQTYDRSSAAFYMNLNRIWKCYFPPNPLLNVLSLSLQVQITNLRNDSLFKTSKFSSLTRFFPQPGSPVCYVDKWLHNLFIALYSLCLDLLAWFN